MQKEDRPMMIIAAITFIVNIPYIFAIEVPSYVSTAIWFIDLALIIIILLIAIKGHRNKKKEGK